MNAQHEYLKPAEVAARYRVATSSLANWRSLGTGPNFIKAPSGRILYRASEVEAWLIGDASASDTAKVAA